MPKKKLNNFFQEYLYSKNLIKIIIFLNIEDTKEQLLWEESRFREELARIYEAEEKDLDSLEIEDLINIDDVLSPVVEDPSPFSRDNLYPLKLLNETEEYCKIKPSSLSEGIKLLQKWITFYSTNYKLSEHIVYILLANFPEFDEYINTKVIIDSSNRATYNYDSFQFLNMVNKIFFLYIYKVVTNPLKLSRKKKWKRWKLKLKKFRKLRKFKKFLKIRKFKTKMRYNSYFLIKLKKMWTTTKNFVVMQKIPLSQRCINDANLEFFYKLGKDLNPELLSVYNRTNDQRVEILETTTIFLRNFHKKPYWKFRQSRVLHWRLFFKQKTIRKQRYKNFLLSFLKTYQKLFKFYTSLMIYFLKINISLTRLNSLKNFVKNLFVEVVNDNIVIVPLFFSKFIKWKKLKKKSFKQKKKVSKWSYLNFKRFLYPWLQRKKNFPKVIQHLTPKLQLLDKTTQFDPMTSYLFFFGKINTYSIPAVEQFKVNALLKLHMYRYKSNKKCM